MQSRVSVTVERPSVHPTKHSGAARHCCGSAGLLLWAWQAGDIDRQRWLLGSAAAWGSAANASSVMLSADVGS